jgi:hypothetical protein
MKAGIIITLLFLTYSASPQDLNAIKTDADCLAFIRTHIYKDNNFYFDTVFTADELQKMNMKFSHWGKMDFNNDKKPDLFFVGRYKRRNQKWFETVLYLSDTGENKFVSLQRYYLAYYDPIVIPLKLNNKNLLCVYRFEKQDRFKTDSLVRLRSHLYPKGIKIIDTLVYKHGAVINFSNFPSRLNFDSLSIKIRFRQECRMDSFTVYKDGRCNYSYLSCDSLILERQLSFSRGNFDRLSNLVKEIDMKTTNSDYRVSETDHSSALLTIYANNKVITFYDYGMESNFTLQAIYEIFLALEPLNYDQ